MSIRVTAQEVQHLVTDVGIDDLDLKLFIEMANLIVEEDLVPATPTLSAARLTKIELMLAAHYVVVSDEKGSLTSQTTGEATESYHRKTFEGLKMTRWGQQAIVLDITGTLADMAVSGGAKLKTQFRIV